MQEEIYDYGMRTLPSDPALPMAVLSCGRYVVHDGWQDDVKRKHILELYWGISGCLEFTGPSGETWLLEGEQVCFYFPGDTHRIRCISPRAEYRWFTCDGSGVADIIRMFNLQRPSHAAPPCPQTLFESLRISFSAVSRLEECNLAATAYQILCQSVVASNQFSDLITGRFIELVHRNLTDSAFNVNSACQTLGIHRNGLRRHIKKFLQTTPAKYIIDARIKLAMQTMKVHRITLRKVAEVTGFQNQNYFCKVIKKYYGVTPKQLL